MSEQRRHRIKRLKMRSMRRGIKEMDLILSGFAEMHLEGMGDGSLDLYDALLAENDHDIYQWVTEQSSAPAKFQEVVDQIVTFTKQDFI